MLSPVRGASQAVIASPLGKAKQSAPVPAPDPADSCAELTSQRSPLLAPLKELGRASALAVANGVGGLGLFLFGPHFSRAQERDYRQAQEVLKQDGFSQRVATSAFDGLLELMERPGLPGENAKERLNFVMWLTDTNRDSSEPSWKKLTHIFNHFHPDSAFVTHANERGFAHDVADGRKWYNPEATGFVDAKYHGRIDQGSPQVGHFLTAVDIDGGR
jgi:hypothetical protein